MYITKNIQYNTYSYNNHKTRVFTFYTYRLTTKFNKVSKRYHKLTRNMFTKYNT